MTLNTEPTATEMVVKNADKSVKGNDLTKTAPAKEGAKTDAKPQVPEIKVRRIRRNEFVTDHNAQKGTPAEKEYVTINPEVDKEYTDWTRNYVKDLSDAFARDPSLKQNKMARADVELVKALTNADDQPDMDKINKFFDSANGWIVMTNVMSRYAFYANSALGRGLESDTTRNPTDQSEHQRVRLDNKGVLPYLRKRLPGLFVDDMKDDRQIDFTRDVTVFMSIKRNSDERAYVKAITGRDLDNLEAAADDTIITTPGMTDNSTRTPEALRVEITSIVNAKRDFLRQIGVPPRLIDTFPEETLLNGATPGTRSSEQASTSWERDISDAFNSNRGGMRDGLGNFKQKRDARGNWISNLPVPGAPVLPTDYDVAAHGEDRAGNAKRLDEARVGVIIKRTAEAMKGVFGREGEKLKSTLDNRIKNSKAADQETINKAKEEQKTLKTKEADEKTKDPLKTVNEKRDTVKNIEDRLVKEFVPGGILPGGVEATIKDEIDKIDLRIKGPATVGATLSATGLLAERRDIIEAMRKEASTASATEIGIQGAAIKGIKGATVNAAEIKAAAQKAAEDNWKQSLEDLDKERTELTKRKTDLESLRNSYKTAVPERTRAETEFANNAKKNLVATEQAYDTLVAHPANINTTQLESLTVDQLISLTTISPYGPAGAGYPYASTLDKETLRKLIIDAKTEQEADKIETTSEPSPLNQTIAFNEVTAAIGGTINADSVLTMNLPDLKYTLANPPYAMTPADITTKLPLAQEEAKKRLMLRYKTNHEQTLKDYTTQIDELDKIINNPKDQTRITEFQKKTQTIWDRQDKILNEVTTIKKDSQKYIDRTLVNASPTIDTEFSAAEKTAVAPKGYYQLLNTLFDYQAGFEGKSREEYFKEVSAVIPPAKLAILLNESFHLRIAAPTIDSALRRLGQEIGPKDMSQLEIRLAFENMIVKLTREANAL